jgi:small GTP-binding protein
MTDIYQIGTIGDSGAGKTCLLEVFMGMPFKEDHLSTIGFDFMVKDMKTKNGETIKLKIWDTAGQETYHSMALNTMKLAKGIMFIYEVSKRESFINIKEKWIPQIEDILDTSKLTMILVANKIDLPNRVVSTEEGQSYAKEKNLEYFETSAKENLHVDDVFIYLANQVSGSELSKGTMLNSKKNGKKACNC